MPNKNCDKTGYKKNKVVKPIHFQEILSSTTDGQPVTKKILFNEGEKETCKITFTVFYINFSFLNMRFLTYAVVLEKLQKPIRITGKI